MMALSKTWARIAIVVISVIFLSVGVAIADDHFIFGLEKGMGIGEIRRASIGTFQNLQGDRDVWIALDAQKPEDVHAVRCKVHPVEGLMGIDFLWIEETVLGGQIKFRFHSLWPVLKKKYGVGTTVNELKKGSQYSSSTQWMEALVKKDWTMRWSKEFPNKNKWDLERVLLNVHADNVEEGYVVLTYDFKGLSAYEKERSKRSDSEF